MTYKSRLGQYYQVEGKKALKEVLKYRSDLEVPKLLKVVVSSTSKEFVTNPKAIETLCQEIFQITRQKPVVTKARKSNAAFKLREGMPLGVKVDLRGDMMYDFVDRLINIALPRTKDFKGLRANQFDGHGNYSLGVKEQTIFPEINFDKVDSIRGMNIIIVTSAKSDADAAELLKVFNFPFIN